MFGISFPVWIALFYTLALTFFVLSFALPSIRGAWYAPTSPLVVARMLALLDMQTGKRAVDIGSGDGRIVIALARAGVEAHGYESNLFLVLWSRHVIRRAGLSDQAHIHWRSFWRVDFSDYDYVTVFGIFYIMKSLERKLQKELRPGARVVSNHFQFPQWKAAKTDSHSFLYIR